MKISRGLRTWWIGGAAVVVCDFSHSAANESSAAATKATSGAVAISSAIPFPEADDRRPVLPGGVHGQPFWNAHAKRFIYAPSFDLPEVPGAKQYRFTVRRASGEPLQFTAERPTAPLSSIWRDVPEGVTTVVVAGLDASGKVVGESGSRTFYRSPGFDGVVERPLKPYDVAAREAFRAILHAPYVQHWLTHDRPIRTYSSYILPNKVMGALVSAMAVYARTAERPGDRADALTIARRTAEYILTLCFPADAAFAQVPPTYSLELDDAPRAIAEKHDARWLLVGSAVDAAFGFLDLFDTTQDPKYFEAAEAITRTLVRTQEADGTWPLIADWKTGRAIAPQRLVPTWMIFLFDRFQRQYGATEYRTARARAWEWIGANPLKTAQWDAQFEDMGANPPYVNLSREQACDVALLLFNDPASKPQDIEQAEELLRFAEDQFIVWKPVKDPTGWHKLYPRRNPKIWLSPGVMEQYHCYAPVARSSAVMINTYLAAYRRTGQEAYLTRTRALANGLLIGQEWMETTHNGNGEIPTFLHRVSKPDNMVNNSYYAAEAVRAAAAAVEAAGR